MKALTARIVVCLVVLLAGVWLLIPTVAGPGVQSTLEDFTKHEALRKEGVETEKEFPWWAAWLPDRHVALGLDLQGGIDLTLQVDLEEAYAGTVQRDLAAVKAEAEQQGVKLDDVRRERRSANLLLAPGEGTTPDGVRKVMAAFGDRYEAVGSKEVDGRSWSLFQLTSTAESQIAKQSIDQARQTIENRINETGVKEPTITIKGGNAISVQLPGETDPNDAIKTVGTTARLEFLLVDEEADLDLVGAAIEEAKAALAPDSFARDNELSDWLVDSGKLPEGRVLRWEYQRQEGSREEQRTQPHVLKEEVLLTGDDVANAFSANDTTTGSWFVSLKFKPAGEIRFADITGENVGKRFAIMLDNRVKSAPVINERISGTASIRMGMGNIDEQAQDAGQLAMWLRSGALPAKIIVGEVRTVGASLGQQAIDEGVLGAGIGGVLVLLFAAVYYRLSGVLADISLLVNGVLVLALLALVGATLTLPGICGLALTIGMAVDCNIIVYERIREELKAGKAVRAAVEAGFDRAFVAVFDSNLTTLFAGIVLYSYGTGPLRGFAVTLMIGIFTTLFSGVFVSRTLMEILVATRKSGQLSI